jgi:hypothetical protein
LSRGFNVDVRLKTNAPSHPKVKKLFAMTREAGQLAWVWLMLFAGRERPLGIFDGLDDDDVELAAEWHGARGELVAALLRVGLLERCDDGALALHDWSEHQPFAARAGERSETARRNAHHRYCVARNGSGKCHEPLCDLSDVKTRMQSAAVTNANSNTAVADSMQPALPLAENSLLPLPSPSPSPSPSPEDSKTLVEGFVLLPKHHEWVALHAPSVPIETELEMWRNRCREANYTYGNGRPIADAQASFYKALGNAEAWGTYKKPGNRKASPGRPRSIATAPKTDL